MDGIKREVQEELGLDANLLHFVQGTRHSPVLL